VPARGLILDCCVLMMARLWSAMAFSVWCRWRLRNRSSQGPFQCPAKTSRSPEWARSFPGCARHFWRQSNFPTGDKPH